MKICICDDEKREREGIREICKEFFQKKGMVYEIGEAENAEEALRVIGEIDLLVLDIEMPGMDGLMLKNRLQKCNSKCLILFVTSHDEMMPEAFGMNVIGFVEKRLLSVKMFRYLTLAVNIVGRDILIEEKYHSQDIVMVHSEREYCNLYFKDGTTVLIRSSLRKIELELLEADFVRASRAWVVNLKYVDSLEKRELRVAGQKIVISRGCNERFHKAYDEYCERNARYC